MKTNLLPIGLLSAFVLISPVAFTGCAGSENTSTTPAARPADQHLVKVIVNGMVCNFCVTNLDKTFDKTPGVEKAYVNLAGGTVLLKVTDASLPDDITIRTTVADAGFEVRTIERTTGNFDTVRDAMKEAAKVKTW